MVPAPSFPKLTCAGNIRKENHDFWVDAHDIRALGCTEFGHADSVINDSPLIGSVQCQDPASLEEASFHGCVRVLRLGFDELVAVMVVTVLLLMMVVMMMMMIWW